MIMPREGRGSLRLSGPNRNAPQGSTQSVVPKPLRNAQSQLPRPLGTSLLLTMNA